MPESAAPHVPDSRDVDELRAAAAGCTGCHLHAVGTQTVFGRGPVGARLLLVGEQPGDVEDRRGEPFVGPAGAVLWSCADEAGLDRAALFVTNAVKHFKHEVRGKRRIHQKPTTAEVTACHPWLDAEIAAVRPKLIVALGATAARAVLGRPISIGAARAAEHAVGGVAVIVTYHPSAVLRADDRAAQVRRALVEDLTRAAALAGR